MVDTIILLGTLATIAGIVMSIGYLPQAIKIIKRKSAGDLSLTSLITLIVGLTIWLAYGIAINDFPLIITNIVGVATTGVVILLYFKYKSG